MASEYIRLLKFFYHTVDVTKHMLQSETNEIYDICYAFHNFHHFILLLDLEFYGTLIKSSYLNLFSAFQKFAQAPCFLTLFFRYVAPLDTPEQGQA